jgi:hypothetical protein
VICGQGCAGVQPSAWPVLFYNHAVKADATKIAKRFEETHKVKRRIYFVKRRVFQGPQISLMNADEKSLPRMNAKYANLTVQT